MNQPIITELPSEIKEKVTLVNSLEQLRELLYDYNIFELFEVTADYVNFKDDVFQSLLANYSKNIKALKTHLNNPLVQETPIDEARDAEFGWEGYNSIACVNYACDNEGFEYGLLHKSGFNNVNDPLFHKLLRLYANSHYALMAHIGFDGIFTKMSEFEDFKTGKAKSCP